MATTLAIFEYRCSNCGQTWLVPEIVPVTAMIAGVSTLADRLEAATSPWLCDTMDWADRHVINCGSDMDALTTPLRRIESR